jgi:hypothetical protein
MKGLQNKAQEVTFNWLLAKVLAFLASSLFFDSSMLG